MYHPSVIAARMAKSEEAFGITLKQHSVPACRDWCDRLADGQSRDLSVEEQQFIRNELLMVSCSYEYWAQRYATINIEGHGLGNMYPLLDSQRFILDRVAALEKRTWDGDSVDGILVNVLKAARQVGVSTQAETMGAHRASTRNNLFGLVASDVPESSAFIFDMFERAVENLPWWLRPPIKEHVKNTELLLEGGSHFWVGAGKSTRGTTGQRGQLARGKALGFVHLSELSTWEAAEQIDDSLMPTVHINPNNLMMLESTAKGRGNWWHLHWKATRSGSSRFTNIFIPWFAEGKYAIPPPTDWSPSQTTLEHARRCEEVAPRWLGRPFSPSRPQLYWYETTRSYYESKGALRLFLEEYGAIDDEECFQAAGISIFDADTLERIATQMRPLMGVLEVAPMQELR